MSRSYQELIEQAKVNIELWRGDIQNRGTAAMTMAPNGTPRFGRIGNKQYLMTFTSTDKIVSNAAITPVINPTTAFWIEVGIASRATDYFVYQVAGGGFGAYQDVTAGNLLFILLTFTATGGAARYTNSFAGTAGYPLQPYHAIGYIDPVGLSGQWWINGVITGTSFVNLAPPVAGGNAVLYVGGSAGPGVNTSLCRVWQGTPDTNEVQVLYNAYSTLRVPRKV
jgi:hypothetical protein